MKVGKIHNIYLPVNGSNTYTFFNVCVNEREKEAEFNFTKTLDFKGKFASIYH